MIIIQANSVAVLKSCVFNFLRIEKKKETQRKLLWVAVAVKHVKDVILAVEDLDAVANQEVEI